MNEPQPPDIGFITAAYCEHHGYAEYACTKCTTERALAKDTQGQEQQATPDDLSLVKEVQTLRAENERLRAEFGEVMDNLQAAADEFDDGSHAGNNLDETIVEMLRDAKAENARLVNETRQLIAYLNFHQDKAKLALSPAGVIQMLERILSGGAS